nr:hypothetical protein OG491_26610 [Streptomyces sp. NBC_01175]
MLARVHADEPEEIGHVRGQTVPLSGRDGRGAITWPASAMSAFGSVAGHGSAYINQ